MLKEVRANAIDQNSFSYEEHFNWLRAKIKDADCKFYILEYDQQSVGQLRLDKENDEWVIDYSIDPSKRGQGFGKKIIQLILEKEPGIKLRALVLENNLPSIKVFENSGFIRHEEIEINGRVFIKFIK